METKNKAILVLRPTIVYGDPPTARIVRGELEIMGDTVPVRSLRSEQRLVRQLGEEMRMAVGVETRLRGMAAVRFVDRISQFSGEVMGTGIRHFRRVDGFIPSIEIEGTKVNAEMGGADPEDVIAAWVAGEEMVYLPSGGWAPLPVDWLDQYGDRLADLLAARDGTGKVARHALFDLARLCEELDHPPPPELEGLRTLIGDFEGIPEVEPPSDFTGDLRQYQQVGLNWLNFIADAQMGGVLADDMGLGKTIKRCASFEVKPWLCLRSVLRNWRMRRNVSDRSAGFDLPRSRSELMNRQTIITTYALHAVIRTRQEMGRSDSR